MNQSLLLSLKLHLQLPLRACSLSVIFLTACSTTPAADNPDVGQADSTAAAVATTETAGQGQTTADQDNEMICRMELVTGSNRKREVCLTRAQRQEIQRNSRDEFNRNRSLRD